MGMSNVIFGFNGKEVSVPMTEQKARELFHDITGITILDKEEGHGNDHSSGDYNEIRQRAQHPTTEQLVELFKRNINNEVGSELIKDTFYHDYSGGEWRRILTIIHVKIKDALRAVEISEDGKYEKVRYGKYIKFIFIRNKMKTLTLDHY